MMLCPHHYKPRHMRRPLWPIMDIEEEIDFLEEYREALERELERVRRRLETLKSRVEKKG